MLRAREEAEERSREARGEEREERGKREREACARAFNVPTSNVYENFVHRLLCATATNKITPWIIPLVSLSLSLLLLLRPFPSPRSTERRAPRLNCQRFPFCIADYLPRSPLAGTADKQRQRVLRAGYATCPPRVINGMFFPQLLVI